MIDRRRGVAVLGLLLSAALMGSAGPVAAGSPPFTISHFIGSGFIVGEDVPAGAAVKVVHRRGTQTLVTRNLTANGGGEWFTEVRRSKVGDRFVVTVAGDRRTITVPDLRLRLDAATDTVSGRVPTSNLEFDLTVNDVVGHQNSDSDGQGDNDPAEPDGRFSYTPAFPLDGGDDAQLSWLNAKGDQFSRYSVLPSVWVRSGSAKVDGYGVPGSEVTIWLRTAAGDLRGTYHEDLDADADRFDGLLRKNGNKVQVAPGNKVTHSGMPGARLRVRTPDAAIDPSGNGTLTATCFVGGVALIGRLNPEDEGDLSGYGTFATEADGTLTVPDLSSIAAVIAGDRWLVICETAAGLAQVQFTTVPAP